VKIHFEEPQFAFQLLRIVGAAASRWEREWRRTGTRIETAADLRLARRDAVVIS